MNMSQTDSRNPWPSAVKYDFSIPLFSVDPTDDALPNAPDGLTGPEIAAKFVAEMFDPTTDAPVHICSLANERGNNEFPFRKINTRDTTEIVNFAERFDKPGRAVYFCVGTLKEAATARNKNSVAEIGFLFVDIDLKDVDDTRTDVERKLKALKYPPSFVVFSGHGLHAYWPLTENVINPLETGEMHHIEDDLKQLADVVGGDLQVCEIARLMRLPGSHNSKRDGEWIPVEVLTSNGKRFHLEDLRQWLAEQSPVILRKSRAHATTAGQAVEIDPYLVFAKEFGIKTPIDVKKRLDAMMFMGGGDAAIHKTQTDVTASMLSKGHSIDEVVDLLIPATRAAAGEYASRWNWQVEERNIRSDGAKWLKDHPPKGSSSASNPAPVNTQSGAVGTHSMVSNVISMADAVAARRPKQEAKLPKPAKDDANHIKVGLAVISVIRERGDDLIFTEKACWRCSGRRPDLHREGVLALLWRNLDDGDRWNVGLAECRDREGGQGARLSEHHQVAQRNPAMGAVSGSALAQRCAVGSARHGPDAVGVGEPENVSGHPPAA